MEQLNIEGKRSGDSFVAHRAMASAPCALLGIRSTLLKDMALDRLPSLTTPRHYVLYMSLFQMTVVASSVLRLIAKDILFHTASPNMFTIGRLRALHTSHDLPPLRTDATFGVRSSSYYY